MSSLEEELQDLREKNNELVKELQYWKMTAAQRENEKLELMKETNELRLNLSRLRSGGSVEARKLDRAIQSAGNLTLSHLVQASEEVIRTVQLVKTYISDRQQLEATLPRWSSISNTPSSEKVHRVPPMVYDGQSIQPVVSLTRLHRSHLYIPLTRIDANDLPASNLDMEIDPDDAEANTSTEDLGLDDNAEQAIEESQNDEEDFDETPRLDTGAEHEDEELATPERSTENPYEGPSWMLDVQYRPRQSNSKTNLEPDSTTECEEKNSSLLGSSWRSKNKNKEQCAPSPASLAYTPTVRRRKRASPPAPLSPLTPTALSPLTPHNRSPRPPRPPPRRYSNNKQQLKVLVSKLRLEDEGVSPPKRPLLDDSSRQALSPGTRPKPACKQKDSSPLGQSRDTSPSPSPSVRLSVDLSFDAPSPSGATTSHVIVSESTMPPDLGGSGEPAAESRKLDNRANRTSHDHKQDNWTTRENQSDNVTIRINRHENRASHNNHCDSGASRDNKHDNRSNQDTRTSRENRHEHRSKQYDSETSRINKDENRPTQHKSETCRVTKRKIDSNQRESESSRKNKNDNRANQPDNGTSHVNEHENFDTKQGNATSHFNKHENRDNQHGSATGYVNEHENLDNRQGSATSHVNEHENRANQHDKARKPGSRGSRPDNCRSQHSNRSSRPKKRDNVASRHSQHDGGTSIDAVEGCNSHAGVDSDRSGEASVEGRARRTRKAVTYKEKPLNRKMR